MKISRKLPQFEGQKNLIAVAGKQEAVFYLAQDGSIAFLSDIKIPTPTYTDRESYFEKRGNGQTYGSGSVYEPKKQKIITDFLKAFSRSMARMVREYGITGISLFSPAYLSKLLKSALPKPVVSKIKFLIEGNYKDFHPFDLLGKIKKADSKNNSGQPPAKTLTPEKINLLSKIHKAGAITRSHA